MVRRAIPLLILLALSSATGCRRQAVVSGGEPSLPVTPEVFISSFRAAEGITFNGRGELFIGANRGIWLAAPNGEVRRIADVDTHLGQAGIGERDILAADFGPTNVFQHGANEDGIVWRISPDGGKTAVATGIADPNFVLVLDDGSFLVSDDGTDAIYRVGTDGVVRVWSRAIPYPNGMALSLDGSTLYVAQIFTSLAPNVSSDRLWALPLAGREPAGPPRVVARTGVGGLDGLAVDARGRIYVADNGAGRIWRFDPETEDLTLVAEGMTGVASLVFGEGAFDRTALYVTTTLRGGGTIWNVPVGTPGARVYR